jgi:hypothetical protein
MTNMTEQELLSALIDGESVDAEAVAAALESRPNRTLLVEFLRLRSSVQADDEPNSETLGNRLGGLNTVRSGRSPTGLRAAAAIALLTGGALGGAWAESFFTRDRPPEPTRVVQLQLVQGR